MVNMGGALGKEEEEENDKKRLQGRREEVKMKQISQYAENEKKVKSGIFLCRFFLLAPVTCNENSSLALELVI